MCWGPWMIILTVGCPTDEVTPAMVINATITSPNVTGLTLRAASGTHLVTFIKIMTACTLKICLGVCTLAIRNAAIWIHVWVGKHCPTVSISTNHICEKRIFNAFWHCSITDLLSILSPPSSALPTPGSPRHCHDSSNPSGYLPSTHNSSLSGRWRASAASRGCHTSSGSSHHCSSQAKLQDSSHWSCH